MDFKQITEKAIDVRKTYEQYEKHTLGKTWTKENLAQGFVGDVGDLMKLLMAKEGIRKIDNVDEKLAHELADCLWSIIILAQLYEVDLEKSFMDNMDALKTHIEGQATAK